MTNRGLKILHFGATLFLLTYPSPMNKQILHGGYKLFWEKLCNRKISIA
jgi:hypothetical protein